MTTKTTPKRYSQHFCCTTNIRLIRTVIRGVRVDLAIIYKFVKIESNLAETLFSKIAAKICTTGGTAGLGDVPPVVLPVWETYPRWYQISIKFAKFFFHKMPFFLYFRMTPKLDFFDASFSRYEFFLKNAKNWPFL